MELCMREKAVFFLPVNILTVWSPAFLAARHTTVCLDSWGALHHFFLVVCMDCRGAFQIVLDLKCCVTG